ncbi:carnitine 3-dehydrogenase [Rhodovulum imhoffii]|uniref:Carnitine 3-dehydrogenase n=1 Tax=Rhodovulum imhoffii TaxID=365340 RepID=A0A2T5BQY2_9RHOB|nr:3-hydroxyacyl-CoA dehydrogenase NAD-binding domain-containing protein [Rhodovulum imhoffii]MBK5932580.1 hypothetical protein [Rhodovulum imhoffii]PTN01637.1 carnitine 3-dehydrogenase [Rhodovulum imhoffii]
MINDRAGQKRISAILGAGVAGSGWAARFALMGWQVQLYDPSIKGRGRVERVMGNARRSLPGIVSGPMPVEGEIRVCASVAEAVAGAEWIQENLPERPKAKRALISEIQQSCDPEAILASSSSGCTPSELQWGATNPEQIIVAHPANPVYLLPMVELSGSDATRPGLLDRAEGVLREIGMQPLRLPVENGGHVANRLHAALWREAIRLVREDLAAPEDIDRAISTGLGLRWAQAGLFEGLHVIGGTGGIHDFMEQFGPESYARSSWLNAEYPRNKAEVGALLKKLMPHLGELSIAEREFRRDTALVAVMRALKWADAGAGRGLNEFDRALRKPVHDADKPLVLVERAVPVDWTDYNGHMTEARYLHVFANATDRFMEMVGCDAAYIASGCSFFTVETHLRHVAEIRAGARIRVETTCLGAAGKKMHLFHAMYTGDTLLATGEHLLVHVSLQTRRAAPPIPRVAERLSQLAAAHARLPRPDAVGQAIVHL